MNNNLIKTNFSILQWNSLGLEARLNDQSFLLAENNSQYALLSDKTWLLPNSYHNIPSCHVIRQDRHDGYGGVAIVFHRSMNGRHFELNDNFNNMLERFSIDLVGVEI